MNVKTIFVIADNTATYINTQAPYDRLYYAGEQWIRDVSKCTHYDDLSAANTVAETLNAELPVQIITLQINTPVTQ